MEEGAEVDATNKAGQTSLMNALNSSINKEVSRVSIRAKAAVEAAGGTVRTAYYNKLGFDALIKPEWFEKKGRLLPRGARAPPPTKPIPFPLEEIAAMSMASAS